MMREFLPIQFHPCGSANLPDLDALIFEQSALNGGLAAGVDPKSYLIIPTAAPVSSTTQPTEIEVRFEDDGDVPLPFRGRTLKGNVASAPQSLSLQPGEKSLATSREGVVWATST